MKEGKLERKPREKSILERLQEIKQKEEEIKKEDKRYSSPWEHINPEDLIEENQALFDLFSKGEVEAALAKVVEVAEKIQEMKNKKEKESNTGFMLWIDGIIRQEREKRLNEEFKEKDNT